MDGRDDQEGFKDDLARALTNSLRVKILDVLTRKEASSRELAMQLDASDALIAYHVNLLEDLKFIQVVRTKSRGGSTERFFGARYPSSWNDPSWRNTRCSRLGNIEFGALKTFTRRASATLKAGSFDESKNTILSWFTIAVDELGQMQVDEVISAAVEQLRAVHKQSHERAAIADTPLSPLIVGLVALEESCGSNGPDDEA
jgi:Helix-turn-helix domain